MSQQAVFARYSFRACWGAVSSVHVYAGTEAICEVCRLGTAKGLKWGYSDGVYCFQVRAFNLRIRLQGGQCGELWLETAGTGSRLNDMPGKWLGLSINAQASH